VDIWNFTRRWFQIILQEKWVNCRRSSFCLLRSYTYGAVTTDDYWVCQCIMLISQPSNDCHTLTRKTHSIYQTCWRSWASGQVLTARQRKMSDTSSYVQCFCNNNWTPNNVERHVSWIPTIKHVGHYYSAAYYAGRYWPKCASALLPVRRSNAWIVTKRKKLLPKYLYHIKVLFI